MQAGLYVGVSAQVALKQRLETIASNVANMNTTGYRAEEVRFETVLARSGDRDVAFASTGDTFLSLKSGAIVKTDNPLDVAVAGSGWLSISTSGGPAFTRDGRIHMRETGALETVNGNAILDAGGTALSVDPNGGQVSITRNGEISQNGRQVGVIGLFEIDPGATLRRGENASVVPDRPARPVQDFSTNGIVQGFIENANINPVVEMTRLIAVQRAFESVASTLQTTESSLGEAIKTLGGS
ncbi:MAG: flagellar basal-body rod protein FlgF [Beijerinckiaceae bacterium]|nr:flagellar basal-body rod protein FlgF [Beijerinckiaceae bacterium]